MGEKLLSGKQLTFRGSISRLYGVIEHGMRRRIWLLAVLTAAGALSEIVAIGSVVPFIALLSDPSAMQRVPGAARLLAAVGAEARSEQLLAATVILCGAALAAGVFRVLLTRATQNFAFGFGHRMSVEIQRRALLQPYSWQVRHSSSEQLATLEKVETVAAMVVLPLIQSAAAAVQILVILVVLLKIAALPTIVAGVSLGFAYVLLARFARGRLQSSSAYLDTAFERRIKIIQEGFGGIRDVILDGSQAAVLDRFRLVDHGLARARADTAFVSALPRYLIEPVGIIVIAVLALMLSSGPGGFVGSLPALGALALGAQRLLPLVQQLYVGWNNVAASRSLIDDVVRRLQLEIPAQAPPSPRLPFAQAIEFRDVSYAYPESEKPAVADLRFEIPAGARVGLVGRTGSGKTTTADLLMGLLEPGHGQILVDGAPLTDRNRAAWRANIAHVPQILFLADATIAQNIAMVAEGDMDRVRRASRLAQIEQFVETLPRGYETSVGERGARISGGQRQRLALARAIYKDSPLLVLDEATSALDDETETAVAEALDLLQGEGRTIVIIAHRSKLIATCDILLTFEKGRIAAVSGAREARSGS